MRTDTQLHKDVIDELSWQPSIRESEIGVSVKDGVVTLSGFVESYAQKKAAERAAEAVSGIRALAEELQVKVPGSLARTDTEIAHQIVSALNWDVEVPKNRVKARVENGWVTLEGDVEWDFQRAAALRAVRFLAGVKGVINLIALTVYASPTDVSQRIKGALRRSAEKSAQLVKVETHEGTVTLRGRVQSWAQREEVERAVWAAPGVKQVDDHIAVVI